MNAWLSAAVAATLVFAASTAVASDEVSTLASAPAAAPTGWLVRAEGGLVSMQDNWLSLPEPEVGLTLGRDLSRRVSLELTGSAREVGNDQRRSWSALAVVRWAALASSDGRHAVTVAGGPFLEIDNVVHGTLPFAHTELAYVYRAPKGFTVLVGGGPNIALASSSYVAPSNRCDTSAPSDSPVFCIDLGPDAHEIHAGDVSAHFRFAVGWLF
ncbi:MAG TPA: hypothetical protein VHJ20_01755 [Polyangia bacterium]|nr:hypothetical protein [Polyangia bacterium]